ncbi:hypothetical protein [Haloplanus salinus]|nr:hypothetical protein [Haloplanus salinus]
MASARRRRSRGAGLSVRRRLPGVFIGVIALPAVAVGSLPDRERGLRHVA